MQTVVCYGVKEGGRGSVGEPLGFKDMKKKKKNFTSFGQPTRLHSFWTAAQT